MLSWVVYVTEVDWPAIKIIVIKQSNMFKELKHWWNLLQTHLLVLIPDVTDVVGGEGSEDVEREGGGAGASLQLQGAEPERRVYHRDGGINNK